MTVSTKDVMHVCKFKPKIQIFKAVGTNIKEISIFAFGEKYSAKKITQSNSTPLRFDF
jgi:hypothetical protein